MNRRDFFAFFLIGGFMSVVARRMKRYSAEEDVPARFWTKL